MNSRRIVSWLLSFLLAGICSVSMAKDPFAYLNSPCDPYYVGVDFPKLTTPQWVREQGVEAVVLLSIDDMRDPQKYEDFLRPLLDRLKQIDGRAPVSIFTNEVNPQDQRLQQWIDEGLSLEVHTIDHPCPLLQGGDFAKAKSTYDRCVDMMFRIPRTGPVAFRMPCCDSQNTPSPRFWTEIFQRDPSEGNRLRIDSSVFNIITPDDPSLPQEILFDEAGEERFRRYIPFPSFVNTIENYPYPYVINGDCWEFPCVVPSDWEAQNIQKPNNPQTVTDWKRVLDATVIKQGVMPIVFHPHGWIRNDQLLEFVDYADKTYGERVKFLAFDEALKRLNQSFMGGEIPPIDVDGDGYMDFVQPGKEIKTRLWSAADRKWVSWKRRELLGYPMRIHYGKIDGKTAFAALGHEQVRFFTANLITQQWDELDVEFTQEQLPSGFGNASRALRFLDLNNDGTSELFVSGGGVTQIFSYSHGCWVLNDFQLPAGLTLLTADGHDSGLRFVDVNEDGKDDVLFSNGRTYSLHLFVDAERGWSRPVRSGKYGDAGSIPPIVRVDGTNNGAWFHSRHMWVQNEDTNRLPDLVDRISFAQLLAQAPAARVEDTTPSNEIATPPRSPQETLNSFQKRPGMTIELVASEPDIRDPVAFDWGPDGKLWVAEMRDYPNGITWNKQGDPLGEPGGCVKLLVDTDRDGKHDQAHEFLDKVPFVSGVKAWRDGVIVTAAPDVFYAEDTDGDGIADKREVLYHGFSEGNQQHRVNGLRWGIDQWLYLANGHSGGEIKSLKTNEKIGIGGRDLRIKPDQGLIETQSGATQCGRVSDDEGNWFGGDNSNPVWHYALDEHYLGRNPHYAPPSATHHVSVAPGAAPIFPASRTVTRFNDFDRANRFTSACSPEVFRDDYGMQKDPRRFIYVCEPVHNMVAREVLSDNGTTFTSQRAETEQDREILASTDNWVRPSMARTGPDGALWIADMYRLVIEHPEWIPKQWQDRLDLRGGTDKGRIYRVRFDTIPENHEGIVPWYTLDKLPTAKLVSALDSSNGTLREMVQQLIYWRNDRTAIAPLKGLLTGAQWPQSRLNALYLLHSFDAADDALLVDAIKFGGGRLSRHAIRLAESRLNDSAELRDALIDQARLRAVAGADRRARQQLAYSLGMMKDPRVGKTLARLAMDYRDDPYMTAAVMTSANPDNVVELLDELLRRAAPTELVSQVLGFAVAMGKPQAVNRVLVVTASHSDSIQKFAIMRGIVESISRSNASLPETLDQRGRSVAESIFRLARDLAKNTRANASDRAASITLLGYEPDKKQSDAESLLAMLNPVSPPAVQTAAVAALGRLDAKGIPEQILEKWSSFSPQLRQSVVAMLMSRSETTLVLLNAVAAGSIHASQINARQRQQLLRSRNADVAARAEKVFARNASTRQQVVDRYASARELEADATRGREVFAKRCATCHKFDGQGHAVGPDLVALSDKSHAAMLAAILDPNRAVEDKYLDYAVATTEGQQFSGLLSAETAASITLKLADGKQQQVLRNQIEEIQATGKSLMPEGLEQDIPLQDMADLIAHLRSVRIPPKRFPGNEPQIAPVRDDGSIRLFAIHAQIYGPTLVLEPQYRNLGFWASESDRAVWKLDVPQAGTFSVNFDYACDDGASGNQFVLTANGESLRGVVPTTGTWDNYSWRGVGEIELPAGEVEVTLRADGPLSGYLGDFRTIILEPQGAEGE